MNHYGLRGVGKPLVVRQVRQPNFLFFLCASSLINPRLLLTCIKHIMYIYLNFHNPSMTKTLLHPLACFYILKDMYIMNTLI